MKVEEHKSRVIDTSKNIYKPCFNMPPKEKSAPSTAPTKKEKIPRSNFVETPLSKQQVKPAKGPSDVL